MKLFPLEKRKEKSFVRFEKLIYLIHHSLFVVGLIHHYYLLKNLKDFW